MPNKELQELLSARFDGHTHTTDESVWSAIESQLDEEKSDRAAFWFWIFNGIAATLLVGLIFQSSIRTGSLSSLSESQLAEDRVKQEVKIEPVSNQSESSNKEKSILNESSSNESKTNHLIQTKTAIRVSTSLRHTSKSTESSQSTNAISTPLIGTVNNNSRVDNLKTRILTTSFPAPRISEVLPKSTSRNSGDFFQRLPIHLGAEFTYLHRTRTETDWLAVANTDYASVNSRLATNRHFEFSLFSQFDFTKRFSASIGIGYSSSKHSISPSSPSLFNTDPIMTGVTKSDQRILTIPIQAKFAFFQKNRFALSTGLTFQGEFGRTLHSDIEQETSVSTNVAPLQVYESEVIVTKHRIQQFAFEPFLQLSVGISPRISTFANLGYRTYFGQAKTGSISPNKLSFINADIGINYRIH
ncbi:MAG: hypothetical protein HRT58_19275 [Crocinitomicaceae bacterium]|nr:hypothetical protein [Flavobacteriales bacterium]NQZ37813.1 hypothetical protein [Crocinitomicaceae bacterium]